jgi:hypothetical protein
MRLPTRGAVAILPQNIHDWLDGLTKVGFGRTVVIRYALERQMERDRKELLQALVVFKDKLLVEGEEVRD